ncbi:hypothetical protein P7H16_10320 [Paenibacillus larvae]|nr:hypothetical protein [Paenibacillus larvae]MDT2247253.1 hypothetical protein [Paenibacillus larvae]
MSTTLRSVFTKTEWPDPEWNLFIPLRSKESVLFYEEVIEGEKYNHSDRIPALST